MQADSKKIFLNLLVSYCCIVHSKMEATVLKGSQLSLFSPLVFFGNWLPVTTQGIFFGKW